MRRERPQYGEITKSQGCASLPQRGTGRRFWDTHDTADYVDWSQAREAVFPNLKPSTTTISLRLPAALLGELKTLANKRDVPYQ